MVILGIERNTILSFILAGILLLPLIVSIRYPMTEAIMIPINPNVQKSAMEVNSTSVETLLYVNPNITINNNGTQVVNIGNNTNTTLGVELGSNITISSKNNFKNETDVLSNFTFATGNFTSLINSIGQSSGVAGDFNGDGYDDLAIGVPYEDAEIGNYCTTNLPVSSVTASGNDGNVPQNVLDNNLDTRWSSFGIGQSITADLGSIKRICSINIGWYNGDSRQYHLEIATSTDGSTFTNMFSGNSHGSKYLDIYNLDSNARYVKIVVNGNTVNDWAAITELDIFEPPCTTNLPVSSVTASGNDGNVPQNVFDNNLDTRWSSFGIGQSITADLGSIKSICSVDIAWYNGASRQYRFDIYASIDGATFKYALNSQSSGMTSNSETYVFNWPIDARYVKIVVNGNTVNDWAAITELDIYKSDILSDSGAVQIMFGWMNGLGGEWYLRQYDRDLESNDQFGSSLATGDFDGDGYSDLAIGVPGEDVDRNYDGIDDVVDAGAVNVIYGHSFRSEKWTQEITGGLEPGDLFGYTLKTGDFNNDGFSDLAIGVPAEDIGTGISNTGAVNVIYGSSDGLRATAISQGNGRDNQIWTQNTPGIKDAENFAEPADWFGSALSTDDFNKDGFSDLAIGISDKDVGGISDAGQVIIVYGTSNGLSSNELSQGNGRAHQVWRQGMNGIRDNAESGDRFGHAMATGDFNKDGFPDLAIGAWEEKVGNNVFSGAVNVIYGSSDGLRATAISQGNGWENQIWMQGIDGVNDNAESGDRFGTTLATGDFNKDGISDLAIATPYEDLGPHLDAAGAVNVIYGSSAGLSTTGLGIGNGRADQIWTQNSTNVEGDIQVGDLFGLSLTTGDFNKDGISDLAIGVPGEDANDFVPAAGAVNVIYGSTGLFIGSGGLSATVPPGGSGRADQLITQNNFPFNIDEPQPEDHFGSALG